MEVGHAPAFVGEALAAAYIADRQAVQPGNEPDGELELGLAALPCAEGGGLDDGAEGREICAVATATAQIVAARQDGCAVEADLQRVGPAIVAVQRIVAIDGEAGDTSTGPGIEREKEAGRQIQ